MRANNYRKSLTFSKQNHFQSSFLDLNESLDLSSSFRLADFRECQSMSLSGSHALNQTSVILNGVSDCDIKSAKKKMGIQLSILEKNILCQSKENGEKSRRLNRSGFIKNKQNESRVSLFGRNSNTTKSTSLNQLLKSKKNAMEQCKIENITSADLQEIRKMDKDIYKLYIDLYHDERELLEKKREKDALIEQLKLEIQKEQEKQNQFLQEIDRIKQKQMDVAKQIREGQRDWLKNIRQKLQENL